jgi:hypothetical protein
MPTAGTSYPEPDRYWNFLSETLSRVFGRSDAVNLVGIIRKNVEASPCQEQLLFFHSEPLDIAAEFTQTEVDSILVSKYLSLVRQLKWGK